MNWQWLLHLIAATLTGDMLKCDLSVSNFFKKVLYFSGWCFWVFFVLKST